MKVKKKKNALINTTGIQSEMSTLMSPTKNKASNNNN